MAVDSDILPTEYPLNSSSTMFLSSSYLIGVAVSPTMSEFLHMLITSLTAVFQ